MSDEKVQVKITADSTGVKAAINSAQNDISNFEKNLLAAANAFKTDKINSALQNTASTAKKSMEDVSYATAGATREFLVLGHETLTGNFSRIPGSLIVLAERMGGLHTIIEGITASTIGWAAAIGTALYATYEWITASEKLAEVQQTIQGALQLNNQSASFSDDAVKEQILSLRKLADVSKESAEQIITGFARAGNISVDLKNKLINLVGDFAAATGKDAPKAAQDLIKIFEQPEAGAKNLANTFNGILSPAQLQAIDNMVKNGNAIQAQNTLYDDLAAKIDDFRINHLTPLQKTWESFTNFLISDKSFITLPQSPVAINAPFPFKNSAPGEQQDQMLVAQQQHQNEINQLLKQAFETEQNSGLEISRKNDLLQKQALLIKAASAETALGNNAAAARFIADSQEIQKRIDNLTPKIKPAHIIDDTAEINRQINEYNRLALAEMASDQLAAENSVKQEQEKNQQNLDDYKITNIQFIQNKLELQKQLDDVDIQAAKDKRDFYDAGTADYQTAQNELLKITQKRAENEQKINHELIVAQSAERKQFIGDINASFENSIAGFLSGTQSMTQAFHNFTRSIIDDIAKIGARNIASGLFGAGTGASGTGGGLGAILASSIFGGFLAGGGAADSGKGYIVGENGPEFFMPKTSGTVYNQTQMGGNVTMNISTPNAESFRQNAGQIITDMNAALRRSTRNA